jgi:hypothetical protein
MYDPINQEYTSSSITAGSNLAQETVKNGIISFNLDTNAITVLPGLFKGDKQYVKDNVSHVKFSLFSFIDTFTGNKYYSIYVKPIGIDTLFTDYVENNLDPPLIKSGALYAYIDTNESSRKPFIIDITKMSDPLRNRINNVGYRIQRNLLDKFLWGAKKSMYASRENIAQLRFFYGYADGTVSTMTNPLYFKLKAPGAKIIALIK